jgi:hypothetical protein
MKKDLKCLRFQYVEWMYLDNNKGPVAGSCGHLGSIHRGKYLRRVPVTMSNLCHYLLARATCLVLAQKTLR